MLNMPKLNRPNLRHSLSKSWLILTGAILTALPLSAIAAQSSRITTGQIVTLPFTISHVQTDELFPLIDIQVYLNRLNLDRLAGDNNFEIGQTAFVFLKQSGSEAYPYAILRTAPSALPELPPNDADELNNIAANDTHMIRARVTDQIDNQLILDYGFERISPQQSFIQDITSRPNQPLSLSLALSSDGRSSVATLYNGKTAHDQRVILKSVLLGRSNKSDNIAPPR